MKVPIERVPAKRSTTAIRTVPAAQWKWCWTAITAPPPAPPSSVARALGLRSV